MAVENLSAWHVSQPLFGLVTQRAPSQTTAAKETTFANALVNISTRITAVENKNTNSV